MKLKVLKIIFLSTFSIGLIYSLTGLALSYYEAGKAEAKINDLRKAFMEMEETPLPSPVKVTADVMAGLDFEAESDNEINLEVDNGISLQEPEERIFEIAPRFRYLHSKNNDLVGWIRIPGTGIDYPVMQNPGNDLFYDRVNFDGVRDEIGIPYLDGRCDIAPKNQIQTIFGHNIRRRGLMFHDLTLYEDKDFWEENQLIRYDTLYDNAIYHIFAAIHYDARYVRKNDFQFHRFTHFSTAKGFDNTEYNFKVYKEEILERALYETGIDFEIDDQYLILATCDNSSSNSRFVLFAKQVYE